MKHGLHKSRTYKSWSAMISRCYNKHQKDFKYYGRIGITMCEFLRISPVNLLALLGHRPIGTSIDRIDNNGNYSCGQCAECRSKHWSNNIRWATPTQQVRNRRNTLFITLNGVTHNAQDWEIIKRVTVRTIRARYKRGLSAKHILTPVKSRKFLINGVSRTIPEWSRITGLDKRTIGSRMGKGKRGKSLICALKTNRRITINGKTRLLSEWDKLTGIPHRVIRRRLNLGWSGQSLLQPIDPMKSKAGKSPDRHSSNSADDIETPNK